MRAIDDSHDPDLRSWVESANSPETDFPIQNLPLAVCRRRDSDEAPRAGVAIGDQILDLVRCREQGLLDRLPIELQHSLSASSLNPLMALGPPAMSALRGRLVEILRSGSRAGNRDVLVPMDDVVFSTPAVVGDFSDFYASVHHATNVGRLFRPENPLLPNYKHLPIGYHGRSSSIVASGAVVTRPSGQIKLPADASPVFRASAQLDYEAEIGILIGATNRLGQPVLLDTADDHLFGLCLLNDWSARDIQAWEFQPLGPFLSKSFLTTISPWVVTLEALTPFRSPVPARPAGDPQPLPYLSSPAHDSRGAFDIEIEVFLTSKAMRERGEPAVRLSRSAFREMYWTPAQMLTHHTSNGCNVRPGDLIGSGTVSGPTSDSLGCLLEITRGGRQPIALPGGEMRAFLEDGDEVVFRAHCTREGRARIGFGECRGTVGPALRRADTM